MYDPFQYYEAELDSEAEQELFENQKEQELFEDILIKQYEKGGNG